MRTILFDLITAQPRGKTKYHGGGEYTKAIYYELYSKHIEDVCIYVLYDSALFLDEWIVKSFDHKNIHGVDLKDDTANRIKGVGDIDVFFEGIVSHIAPQKIYIPEGCMAIGVYHGLRVLEIPPGHDKTELLYVDKSSDKLKIVIKRIMGRMYFRYVKGKLQQELERYDCLIGDSMHAIYAVKTFFPGLTNKRIELIYAAPKLIDNNKHKPEVSDNKTILMLNSDRWGKNSYRGISALDSLFSDGYLSDFVVNITGVLPSAIKKRVININRFKELGYVSSEELEKEYASCHLLFYPTLNEGFGYPPIEAMKYGKTCLISCNSSLPELFSGYVYFCNQLDINEMKTRLLMACENPIDPTYVIERYKQIHNRQVRDTDRMISIILGN